MKKILIIGANSYIAKSFISSYHDQYDLTYIKRDENFRDYFELTKEDFAGIDIVINFTAIVHQKGADESLHKKYNYELVKYMATLAKEAKIRHFIHFSTIAVYGDKSFICIDTKEDPITPYGRCKLKADRYLKSIMDNDFKVAILRPTIVYGVNAPGNMKMLKKLLAYPLPFVFGYDKNKRSILFIENLTNALSIIIDKECGGIFLLRDKEMPSINEITTNLNQRAFIVKSPKFLINFLLFIVPSIFDKLYDDLIIDDKETIKKIGEYRKVAFKDAIKKI